MERSEKTFKKQMGKIFMGGMLVVIAFLVIGVGVVKKANADANDQNPYCELNTTNYGSEVENTYHSKVSYVGNSIFLDVDNWTSSGAINGLIYKSESMSEIDTLELFGPESVYGCADKIKSVWHYDWNADKWNLYSFEENSFSFLNNLLTIKDEWKYQIIVKESCTLTHPSNDGSFWKAEPCETGCENGACIVEDEPSITITSPNGGETLKKGETYDITWTQSNINKLTIYLLRDSDSYQIFYSYNLNQANTSGNYSHSYTITDNIPEADDYKIWITGYNTEEKQAQDKSDDYFNIVDEYAIAPPTNIKVTGILNNRYNEAPQITWTSPAGIKLSRIYRSTIKGELGQLLVSKDFPYYTSSNDASYVDSNSSDSAQYGIDYYYTVRSAGMIGTESENTNQYHYRKDRLTDVVFPNGEETLEIGKSYNIKWSSTGNTGKIDISLMENYNNMPREIKTLFSDIENDGSVLWTPDSTIKSGSNYKIRIRNTEKIFYDYNDSDDNFSIIESDSSSGSSITITSPMGGKTLPNGPEKFVVTWNWTGLFESMGLVLMQNGEPTLALGRMPDAGHVLPGIGGYFGIVPNTGSYSTSGALWDEVGSGFTVRAINLNDTSVFDETEEFSLYNPNISIPRSITVTSPNSGEELKIGKQHLIQWNTTGNVSQVTIALNKNGVYIKNLIWNINNNGSISWTPDLSLESGDDYKIRITDPDNDVYDESDNYFSITKSSEFTCLPDNTLLKIPNDPKIYVIRNCERHWIRTAEEFKQGGYKWENIKISTSDVINSFPEVFESEEIKEGAIIRAIDGVDIYIVKYIGNKKFIRLILNPSVFNSYGHLKWEDVIEVEKETIDSFVTSNLVRNAKTGKIYRLTANGDNGTRRHFKSISVMQEMGCDLDAVYEINGTDENSYEQGEDLK